MGFLSEVLGTNNKANPMDPGVAAQNKALAPQSTYSAPGDYNANIADTVAKENQNYSDQTGFIDSLTQRANGTGGPSVAQNMLRQSTDANTAGVASQVASTRSLSPAQQARLAVEGGAQTQTQAAGQLATLRAQEQTMATSLLGQALGQRGGQNLNTLGTLTGAQSGLNSLNQSTAAQNASLQLGQEQLAAGVGAGDAATSGAIVGGLLAGTGLLGPMAQSPVKGGGGESLGGPGGGAGAGAGASSYESGSSASFGLGEGADAAALAFADGGEIAEASPISSYMNDLYSGSSGTAGTPSGTGAGTRSAAQPQPTSRTQPESTNNSKTKNPLPAIDPMAAYNQIAGAKLAGTGSIYAAGGKVSALVSPGEIVAPPGTGPKQAARMAEAGAGKVPGQAKVDGDSPKNDTVKADLRPGSIVLPRSVVDAADPGKAAASFVASVMRRSDKRYAVGGKVTPEPAAHQDLSEGGFVDESPGAAPISVSRGQGGLETNRRLKPAKKPGKEAR